jgi:hypothetical protein
MERSLHPGYGSAAETQVAGERHEIPVGPGHVARCILLEKAPRASLSSV